MPIPTNKVMSASVRVCSEKGIANYPVDVSSLKVAEDSISFSHELLRSMVTLSFSDSKIKEIRVTLNLNNDGDDEKDLS